MEKFYIKLPDNLTEEMWKEDIIHQLEDLGVKYWVTGESFYSCYIHCHYVFCENGVLTFSCEKHPSYLATYTEVKLNKSKEETNMTKKIPHRHKDLIIAWADGEAIEFLDPYSRKWTECSNPAWLKHIQYRVKPREFVVGEWYPVVNVDGDELVAKCVDTEGVFKSKGSFSEYRTSWIGDSLGKIEFGGE